MIKKQSYIIAIFCLIVSSCSINKHLNENEFLVEKNDIKRNGTNIDKKDLEAFLRQKPNRKILKLIRFNLWLYNQVNQKKMVSYKVSRDAKFDRINQKRIERSNKKNEKRNAKGKKTKSPRLKNKENPTYRESILEAGEPPVILDSTLTRITSNQLQKFVFSRGYFNSVVTDSTYINKKSKRAKVFYSVSESKPYIISNINYKIEDPLIEYFILNDTSLSLIKINQIYNEDVFQKERLRITENNLNNGFYYFATDYVHYALDTNLVGNFVNVTIEVKNFTESNSLEKDSLIFKNHPRYYIKNVYIIPEVVSEFRGKASDIYMKDTTVYNGLTILHNQKIKFRKKDLTRGISISPGQLYQQHLSEETYKDLSALKVFKSVFLQYQQNPYESDKLDCYIICQPLLKQAITVQAEGTNTSGNLGVAGSLVFQNKNLFRGAELLELKLNGSLTAQRSTSSNQQQTTANLSDIQRAFNTFQFGPELNIYFPKPLFPFTLFYYKKNVNEKRYFRQPKTILNMSLNYQSSELFNRNISSISYGFRFTNNNKLFNYDIVPFEAYRVNAQLSESYKKTLSDLNDFFLLNSFADHLTTLSKISAVYNNQSIIKKRNVMYLRMTISSSGNILRGLYKLTNQPKDTAGRYLILKNPFSQFLKLDVDYRFYFKIRNKGKLVYRFAGGVAKPLANLSILPYEQSFFAGGPNGIRAWRARTLGPGSYDASESNARFDKIGDIQLESNIEYRFHIFKSFYGAWFMDGGNVWTLNINPIKPNGHFETSRFYKEIALGSGFGIRYDFSFFVVRLDAAVRLYDPQYQEGNRWMFDKQTIRKTTILNFGIGYPF